MYTIKNINVLKFAKLFTIVSFVVGFILALLWLIVFLTTMGIFSGDYDYFVLTELIPFAVMPISFTVAGFVVGLIIGAVYNRLAEQGWGLEIEIEKLPEEKI